MTVALVAVAMTATAGVTVSTANAATPQRIGVAPQVPHDAVRAGTPAGSASLHVDVELAPRDPAALSAFARAVSDPKSPQYKHYLAKGRFGSVFGPTQATINAVTSQLRAEGLNPGTPTPDGLTIPVTTTIAQASAVWHTGFLNYRLANGRTVFANTEAPALPAGIAGEVIGVVGLNDIVAHTADNTAARRVGASAVTAHVSPRSGSPQVCGQVRTTLDNHGLTENQDYWLPAGLSDAYGTSSLSGNYGDMGQNVTVGLLELESYSPDDITQYQNCFGTNVSVTAIPVDGGPSAPPSELTHVGRETALDVEAVAGMAPHASVEIYQGKDASVATDADMLDVEQKMENDDSAQVVSISWSTCELNLIQADPTMLDTEAEVFSAEEIQGQTAIAASGDFGSTECDSDPSSPHASQLSVADPADQYGVTAVGGTRMTGLTSSGPAAQSTWNTAGTAETPGQASGGGVSAHTELGCCTNYQSGVTGAGYTNACSAPSGFSCRQVPDVAALADPASGYVIAFGSSAPNEEDWWVAGGTSLAAPLWAAIAALADAGTACAGNGNAGFLNPALYQHAGDLMDITTGNNFLADSGYTGGLYSAGTGYDLATGLGAPNAAKIVEDVCGVSSTAPGSDYVPVTPTRIMDTGSPGIGPNGTQTLQIADEHGVPLGVSAVVLNVTAVNPTANSYLTVYPDSVPRPTSSNLNFSAGQTIPNLVTVRVSPEGGIAFYNHSGNVQVLADLEGYYVNGNVTGESTYEPVTPTRLLAATPVGPNGHQVLAILGQGGVPSSGVVGVILNVTATAPTDFSYLSVYPDGGTQPVVSNLNVTPGETIPNLVIVPVGNDGKVNIYNHVGTTDVLADVEGYYTSSQTGLKFHPSAPHRLLDTRDGDGVAALATGEQPTPIGGNSTLELPVGDVNGVPGNGGPIGTSGGLVLNVVATGPTDSSYLKVFPSAAGSPTVSNLNFSPGETIPNAVLTPVNGPFVDFYNHVGSVDVVVDVFGYFAAN